MGKIIQKFLGVYFICFGVLPFIFLLYLFSRLPGTNIIRSLPLLPFFLIPIFIGILIWKSKRLLKVIGIGFIFIGSMLMIAGIGPGGIFEYFKFAFFQLLPNILLILGVLHLFLGWALFKRKKWGRLTSVVFLIAWTFIIINFFMHFVYTRIRIWAVISNSLLFVIPLVLSAIYLMSSEARKEFLTQRKKKVKMQQENIVAKN